jgi:hypothetical protein
MREFAEAFVAAVCFVGFVSWCVYFIVPLLRW